MTLCQYINHNINMPTKTYCGCSGATGRKSQWALLLAMLGWAQAAAGQATLVIPLVQQGEFDRTIPLGLDSTQHLRHLPKGLTQYMLKYLVVGGLPGQPPAQRLNFLIGRDAKGRIVFVPAEPGTLKLRRRSQQILPATPGEPQPQPFQVAVRGLRGPMTLTLRPEVYPSKTMTWTWPWKNDLTLFLERAVDTNGTLRLGAQDIALRAGLEGPRSLVVFTDSVAVISVLDGQHQKQRYRIGESFLATEYLVKLQHISPAGDSLTVQVTEPANVAPLYGKDAGFLFRPVVLADVLGQPVSLLGTERPLVLDFWGTWCGPCVELTPALKTLHAQYARTADIVSIALDEPERVKKYLAANNITWTNIAIQEQQRPSSLIDRLGVASYPSFLLIYKGKIYYRGVGAQGLQELTQQLARLH